MRLGSADPDFQWSYEGADEICLVTFFQNINIKICLLHFLFFLKEISALDLECFHFDVQIQSAC